ncbi:TetR/AcrR family transcriptional regulator [Streptomyces sp. RFCAC02]|uniref:TetR/AcrR family transcriptional regulator n=1 Tax=Streptomyces sp. RFCAC02 TaxID=2499143 RepID=UPI001021BA26|nr:TetR/AcrR family transcriptional regulator [Streptomyces sp. RFCAC02]
MTEQSTTPAKQRRGRDTVERLLRAAFEVYRDAGPGGFTMTAVTEVSGVSVGSLYHHFGSFDGLAATLYIRCKDDLMRALVDAARPTRSARDAVRAVVGGYLRWSASHPTEALVIHASPYAGYLRPHAERVEAGRTPLVAELLDLFAPHIAAGRLRPLPPAVAEMLIMGPVVFAVTRWLAGTPGFDLDEAARELPDSVWLSLRGTG